MGCNLVNHILNEGNDEVIIYDNLSRRNVEKNLEWLKKKFTEKLDLVIGDVRDYKRLERIADDVDIIYHTAAQVAVTSSLLNPREDFEINALGTLNVLEAARRAKRDSLVIFTSTNKVYGEIKNEKILEKKTRYCYAEKKNGISEDQPLDFHSPYGCSKGSSDQYVRDYSRIYGLKTVVFRLSCVYGPRQFGNEDQGWVAHFVISSVIGKPLTIYGDGKQVRDILFIDDLVRAFELATQNIDKTRGKVYNIGGGRANIISLLELVALLKRLLDKEIVYAFDDWRFGDQKVYYSDISKAHRDFGWMPRVSKENGIQKLFHWVCEEISRET